MYWRLPKLLPDEVKYQRQEQVQECAYVAAALTVVDYFRFLGAERKRMSIKRLLSKKIAFESWVNEEDSHRKRFEVTFFEKRTHQRDEAKKHKLAVGLLLPEPVTTHDIVLEYMIRANINDMPKEYHPHTQAVKDLLINKVPQPINGIEQFKKMIDRSVVILRPVDPFNVETFTYKDEKTGKDTVRHLNDDSM
jgi:hypothetical protein